MSRFIIESKALDGRYDGVKPRIVSFPSGHMETYQPCFDVNNWLQESIPLSFEKAEAYLKERTERYAGLSEEPCFAYRMREVK